MNCALPRRHAFRAGAFALLALWAAAPAPAADPMPAAAPAPVLTLWDCRQLAHDKQPTLAAYRASLAFAEARAQALADLCTPALIRPDLPLRREQAALGVQVARAQLCQAEWETTYNATRNYISALYAREQWRVAQRAIAQLTEFQESTDVPPPAWLVARAEVYKSLARGRQQEATQGFARALAALREAMGVGPDFCLHLADAGLHRPAVAVCREDVLALALSRRGEVAQTAIGARIAALEVDAQGLILLPTANTFAAGSDIHAQPVAQGLHDGTYRPGAMTVEMPTLLAGPRHDRVVEARALQARTEEVVVKTRNLVALEVEDAFHRWLEASAQTADFADATARAARAVTTTTESLKMGGATPADAFAARQLSIQTQLEYNTAVYNALLALTALERITAGGFCPGFEALFAPGPPPALPAALASPDGPAR